MAENSRSSSEKRKARHLSPGERMRQAIDDGDPEALAEILEDGVDLGAQIFDGYTPLELAVQRSDVAMVTMLLDAGADPNRVCAPILREAVGGPIEIIEALIVGGAEVDAFEEGETALSKAAYRGDLPAVDLLLEAGADPRAGPALLNAARQRHRQIAERLLPYEDDEQIVAEAQALLDEASRIDRYPGCHPKAPELFEAIQANDITAVRQRLASGLPPNALIVDRRGRPISALRAACRDGREGIARLLLKAGASIDGAHDAEGPLERSTPLIDAIRSGSMDLAKRLIAAGADVDALRSAGAEGEITPLLHLVGPGIPMHEDGSFPIAGIIELIRCLARAGANLDSTDAMGQTALIWASRRGDPRLVEALLRLGADPEIRDSDDNTAWTYATYQHVSLGYPPRPLKYLGRRANPTRSDFRAILDLLRECRSHRGLEAHLIAAAFHGDVRTVRRNLERGAAVDHKVGGSRALEVAVLGGHGPVLEALVDAGAEVTDRQRRSVELLLSGPA